VNRIDQETAKRRGPTRAVEPFKKKKSRELGTVLQFIEKLTVLITVMLSHLWWKSKESKKQKTRTLKPEDGGYVFNRNVRLSPNYTAS
jgi:hypothetical protein